MAKSNARDSILHAALQEFSEQGYDRATVDSIAQRSHVAKGSVYYHFASKEAIWVALVQSRAGRLEALTKEVLAHEGASLSDLLRQWIDFFWEEQEFLSLFLSEAWRDRSREQLVGQFLNRLLEPVATYLHPHIPATNREWLAYALFGAIAVPTLHALKSGHADKNSLYAIIPVILGRFT
ncbi:MAG: TetR/AcrR family transcriptional regulator [Sulfobacillus thermosulfidooxidans]|uniref:TetR/AcrR family transcriptional regulator n=1 Tax=Sulfobacillus TaxID=28033 RepID=UPI000CD22EA7|nr:TetR/AcrR family transcriptional regulator [Sulfobacillus sp. hq2]POB10260.1 TetR family transcriptional regulator [Sulfobacillus sp. hq2]PSR37938.1 MAG: TetR/AcrR family transcriptional regulator [Sulfobacillus thermosulfidooxidans]